jgi:hypothetical protein
VDGEDVVTPAADQQQLPLAAGITTGSSAAHRDPNAALVPPVELVRSSRPQRRDSQYVPRSVNTGVILFLRGVMLSTAADPAAIG